MASNGSINLELFSREEFRPQRPPCRQQFAPTVRLGLETAGAGNGMHPRLGTSAAGEKMRRRHQPRCVVKCSSADVDDFGAARPLTIKVRPAIAAEPGGDRNTRRRNMEPRFRVSFENVKILSPHRHIEGE